MLKQRPGLSMAHGILPKHQLIRQTGYLTWASPRSAIGPYGIRENKIALVLKHKILYSLAMPINKELDSKFYNSNMNRIKKSSTHIGAAKPWTIWHPFNKHVPLRNQSSSSWSPCPIQKTPPLIPYMTCFLIKYPRMSHTSGYPCPIPQIPSSADSSIRRIKPLL